jgi:hypothetical protein
MASSPRRTGAALLPALALLLLCSCANVAITPAAIVRLDDDSTVPADERRARVATWRAAVAVANGFLASEWRRTLPAGRYELDDANGMTFVTAHGTWPIEVRCTTWGDLCVATGFAAQERERGFVVGESGEERDRLVDNSLFVGSSGWIRPADAVAELILHETTHTVWREGTVGFWNGVAYYLEAIFLLRSNDHSDENRPHATGEEFAWYLIARDEPAVAAHPSFLQAVADHYAQPQEHCEHGPFDEPPPPPPER